MPRTPRVGCVAGTSLLAGHSGEYPDFGRESYVFSRYTMSWGWATWRRAWAMNDPELEAWPALRDTDWLARTLGDPLAVLRWRAIFDAARSGFDTWDYAWTFSCWKSNALAIHPIANLVTNIGIQRGCNAHACAHAVRRIADSVSCTSVPASECCRTPLQLR